MNRKIGEVFDFDGVKLKVSELIIRTPAMDAILISLITNVRRYT